MTLGMTIGDVVAWLLVLWACMDFLRKQGREMEMLMINALKTGMNVLAVLWA